MAKFRFLLAQIAELQNLFLNLTFELEKIEGNMSAWDIAKSVMCTREVEEKQTDVTNLSFP